MWYWAGEYQGPEGIVKQQTFIKHLLQARYHSRPWLYHDEDRPLLGGV